MRKLRISTRYTILALLALAYISPIVFMLVTSFKTLPAATSYPPQWIPQPFTTQAYEHILDPANGFPVFTWFLNSMFAASAHALLVVALASLAAYPLARMQFPGKRIIEVMVIVTLLVPPVILIIPSFLVVDNLGWLNNPIAVIVPTAAGAFGVFFMRQFFLSLPQELEEAARIDGANRFQIFTKIILPLSKPGLATLGLLAFLGNWNDFLWPVFVLFDKALQTLPAGLATLQGSNAVRYDLLMAGSVIASVPVLILFIILQRFVVEGVARSGVKG